MAIKTLRPMRKSLRVAMSSLTEIQSRPAVGSSKRSTSEGGKSVVRNLTLGYVSGQPVIAYETEESGENVIYLKNGQDEKKIAGESAQIEKGILYYLSVHFSLSWGFGGLLLDLIVLIE